MSFRKVLWESGDPELEGLPKALKNMQFWWEKVYERYLELARILQERDVPVKRVDP